MSDPRHPIQRLVSWCERRPVVASLVAVVTIAALAGMTVALLESEKARARRAALVAEAIADEKAKEAEADRIETVYAADPFQVERLFQDQETNSAVELLAGLDAAIARRPTNAILWCARAAASQAMGDRERALAEFTRSIDLTSTTPGAKTPKDALVRRSALLRELNRIGEAGQDHRRAFGLPFARSDSANELPDFSNAAEVSFEFGETNREAGLYFLIGSDSKHQPAVTNGEAAQFFREGWNYAYFFIDPTFKWKLGSNVLIRVEYQLVKGQPIGLQYDGARNAFATAAKRVRPPVGQWQVVEFVLRDARFSHRQNLRADFRVYDNERGFYLRRVTVSRYQPSPLIIPPRDPALSPAMIDLTKFYNGSGRHYAPGGQLERLPEIREGVRRNTGIDFDVRGSVGLFRVGQESDGLALPATITGIPIRSRVTKMHFLHSASYKVSEGTVIGAYVLRMADGSAHELPLVYGVNVRIERSDTKPTAGAELAWTGEGIRTGAGTTVRILKMTWTNPQPELVVESLDFTSTRTACAPHLLGITIEREAVRSQSLPAISENVGAWHPIELSSHFNDSLDDGWQHQLMRGNNLATLPKGRQVFGGVEFDVRGIIQLTSEQLRRYATRVQFPEQVLGIAVGRKCRALHFLHATGWNAASDRWVGTYVIHYAGGEKVSEIIVYGEGTGNWWAMPADLQHPGAGVVWQGTNAANHAVQLFKQSWTNPRPDLEIKSVDFSSRMTRVAPFLIAVTAEP